MNSIKRTYTLPESVIREFEKEVPSDDRSRVLAGLLQAWLQQRRERLRREVIEGCHDMADLYLEIEQDYHLLEEKVHHAVEP